MVAFLSLSGKQNCLTTSQALRRVRRAVDRLALLHTPPAWPVPSWLEKEEAACREEEEEKRKTRYTYPIPAGVACDLPHFTTPPVGP